MNTLICYTSCDDYIIKLIKMKNSKTNECRKNIKNLLFAMHRINKAIIVSIEHKFTGKKIITLDSITQNTTYNVGDIIEKNYCEDIEKEYADGIYFYTNKIAAFYHNLNAKKYKYTGVVSDYFPNGNTKIFSCYVDGLLNGQRTHYNSLGATTLIINYKDDLISMNYFFVDTNKKN